MCQEVNLFWHLAQVQTQALFFPQMADRLCSFIPASSHLLPLHTTDGMVLFLELICVQRLLYTWISLEAPHFFLLKNSSERYFKLPRLARIRLPDKSPLLVEFNPRSHARPSDVSTSWYECSKPNTLPIHSDVCAAHGHYIWAGNNVGKFCNPAYLHCEPELIFSPWSLVNITMSFIQNSFHVSFTIKSKTVFTISSIPCLPHIELLFYRKVSDYFWAYMCV